MECFRCYDMKVVDPTTVSSLITLLRECYTEVSECSGIPEALEESLLDKINRHIILLESMPDE